MTNALRVKVDVSYGSLPNSGVRGEGMLQILVR